MYHSSIPTSTSTGMAMTSPTYSTYNLPRSRIGPVPSSSAPRYGFSIDYADPYPSGQHTHPIWVSCSNPGTPFRALPARENAGLVTLSNAGTPSACTAMRCRREIGSYTARLAVAILGSQTRVSFIFHLWTFFLHFSFVLFVTPTSGISRITRF